MALRERKLIIDPRHEEPPFGEGVWPYLSEAEAPGRFDFVWPIIIIFMIVIILGIVTYLASNFIRW